MAASRTSFDTSIPLIVMLIGHQLNHYITMAITEESHSMPGKTILDCVSAYSTVRHPPRLGLWALELPKSATTGNVPLRTVPVQTVTASLIGPNTLGT